MHWISGQGIGFGSLISENRPGIPRVRFAQPGASYAACSTVAASNQVFCLSCHKAHGSKYKFGLLWPYYTHAALDESSGCAQCHNHGA
jgi:hypothetical protein